jgi:thymidylate synthase ThyX
MEKTKPVIKLIDYTNQAFHVSIASARTCYSSKGVLLPEEMDTDEKAIEIRNKVAKSTKKAGHLTTRQHPQFIFTMDKVSRQFVWAFLHSHPYYNSEQVSQRYVEVKKENFYVPDLSPALLKLYIETVEFSTQAYFHWIEKLKPFIEQEYFSIYRARAGYPEKWQSPIKKKCLEVARYLLPTATYTYLYHTINGLTLHRYHRLMNMFQVPDEQREVVQAMVAEVQKVDPLFVEEMDDATPIEDTTEYSYFQKFNQTSNTSSDFINEFDTDLGNRYSKLVLYPQGAENVLAKTVRSVLGLSSSQMNDKEAILSLLDPSRNPTLSSTLNETTLSPLSRAMFSIHYTFQKKISHTADSQDQRHRMVPGARPILMAQYTGKPDYITPTIIQKYPELQEAYSSTQSSIFQKISRFIDAGGSLENAAYLLPNAFPVRFYESGDLLNLYHKWKSRLCYNAQEEIFYASLEEVKDIASVHPNIAKHIGPPCKIRLDASVKPYCPEGDKYCGVQVWKLDINNYQRVI